MVWDLIIFALVAIAVTSWLYRPYRRLTDKEFADLWRNWRRP